MAGPRRAQRSEHGGPNPDTTASGGINPKTDDHDLNVKVKHARKFLEGGNKVKITVRFRGREITHPEVAQRQLEWMLQQIDDLVTIEQRPSMEGRNMSAAVAPKPQVLQKLSQIRAQRERDKELGREVSAPEHELPDMQDELHEPDDFDDDDDDDEADATDEADAESN